jgi:hypothetical protein
MNNEQLPEWTTLLLKKVEQTVKTTLQAKDEAIYNLVITRLKAAQFLKVTPPTVSNWRNRAVDAGIIADKPINKYTVGEWITIKEFNQTTKYARQ